jgi:orotidine-5'-phosphate decarboxylase
VNPILVALDVSDGDEAISLAGRLTPFVGGFKVGLELLTGEGPDVIRRVSALGLPVFADAKLHDIPNTVQGAARQLGRAGARWVTIHGAGGRPMIESAVSGLAAGSGGGAGVLVVTVLTSLDQGQLRETGVERELGAQVVAMTRLAFQGGAEGIVCAVPEARAAKNEAPSLQVFTPGIRRADAPADDQKRVASLSEALAAGADMVVVGRAITSASDPVAAARALAAEAGRHFSPH